MRMMSEGYHDPVLLKESVEALNIRRGGVYIDATFGGGGHAKAILEKLSGGKLYGFDQDQDAIDQKIKDKRVILVKSNFRYIKKFMRYYKENRVDGLLADLGVSSHQFDTADRGFSTRFDAEMDMRMNRQNENSATEIVNNYPEQKLKAIFSEFGEVRNAGMLARSIAKARGEKKITDTAQFKDIIAVHTPKHLEQKYFAQVFQALRMEVNDELNALRELLMQCADVISKEGRLVVISYHSLEDRLVKNFISKGKFEGELEKNMYGMAEMVPFRALNKKPIVPDENEIEKNQRARSAKLRVAERT